MPLYAISAHAIRIIQKTSGVIFLKAKRSRLRIITAIITIAKILIYNIERCMVSN
jgi:hypothetical protein